MLLRECIDARTLKQIFEREKFSPIAQSIYSHIYHAEEVIMGNGDHIGFYVRGSDIMQMGPADLESLVKRAKEDGVTLDIIYAFDSGNLFIPSGKYEETWH